MSYKASVTAKKSGVEGVVIAVAGTVAVWVAAKAAGIGIDIDPEWVIVGITAIGAAVVRGVSNWIKNRKK